MLNKTFRFALGYHSNSLQTIIGSFFIGKKWHLSADKTCSGLVEHIPLILRYTKCRAITNSQFAYALENMVN